MLTRRPHHRIGLLLGVFAAVGCAAPSPPRNAVAEPALCGAEEEAFPGIRVDLEAGVIDLEARVVQRDADWLELIATSPGGRDHESIVTVRARPSHIHLALVMLGAEPGAPARAHRRDDRLILDPPTGRRVEVFFVLEAETGAAAPIPVNRWVKHRDAETNLPDGPWLFCGSRFMDWQGTQTYVADETGTVISLVNFGDDVLARPTDQTQETDNQEWVPYTSRIPPLGTPLIVRLRPLPPDPGGPEPGG